MNILSSSSGQAQATESLALRAHLLDHVDEPVSAWEMDGNIIYWNQAAEELYGFSSKDAMGSNIHQLLNTAYPFPLDQILMQMETLGLWSGELDYKTSQGASLCIESRLTLIRMEGRPPLVLQNDHDHSIYKQAEAAMRQVYEDLEIRVEERTRELAQANRELESFSYSVSHDLRAPLRSIAGFTRILTLDYAGKMLDDKAVDLMRRMSASVARMGQLIEDMLKLSQVSRTAFHPQALDFTALAESIAEDLRARDPQRQVDIRIEPAMTALADPGLLRMVLDNLIGNAWKFTGKTAGPRIVIGMEPGGGEGPVYFVQDNGAGFNMEFADQLFAPFQRLHRASEFEGTGVGLATVQRVIHRHGGRIWAESTPGSGARFMFTLGTATKSKRKIGER